MVSLAKKYEMHIGEDLAPSLGGCQQILLAKNYIPSGNKIFF